MTSNDHIGQVLNSVILNPGSNGADHGGSKEFFCILCFNVKILLR